LGDSVTITVTALAPEQQTYIQPFQISPTSGVLPFNIVWIGYLSNHPTLQSDDPAVNGETIELQILQGGVWTTVATAITESVWIPDPSSPTGEREIYGRFDGVFTIPLSWGAGTYSFRAHYGGNPSKYLLGCEKESSVTGTDGENGNVLGTLLLIGALITGVISVGIVSWKR